MLNGWIDATEELPHTPTPVLIWISANNPSEQGVGVGYFDCKAGLNKHFWMWRTPDGCQLFGVVAWQPLPFGPNGEAVVSRALLHRDE